MTILLVDDDRNLLQAMLQTIEWERLGFSKVLNAFSAAGAQKILLENETDAVLCDIEMPGASGIDLLAWARKNHFDCEFLYLTCYERFDFATEAMKLGAISYILKPFDPERTTVELERAVDRIRMRKQQEKLSEYGKIYLSNRYRDIIDDGLPTWEPHDGTEQKKPMKRASLPPIPDLLATLNKGHIMKVLSSCLFDSGAKDQYTVDLRAAQQSIIQGTYVFLYQNGIEADLLLEEPKYGPLSSEAHLSTGNMLKWLNFVVSLVVDGANRARRADDMVLQARRYIDKHYTENITRKEVAANVCLTPEYMARVFKKAVGRTIHEYITEQRLAAAKELLSASDLQIADIALRTGFSTPSYFITVFRKETGTSPSTWREQHQA